jgi:hypothetical protein
MCCDLCKDYIDSFFDALSRPTGTEDEIARGWFIAYKPEGFGVFVHHHAGQMRKKGQIRDHVFLYLGRFFGG